MLASCPSGQLSPQLNSLIKPILAQVKKESVRHIQSLACHSCSKLISLLLKSNKAKPAQQILQLITKDIESLSYPHDQSSVVLRGLDKLMIHIAKEESPNLLVAYGRYF